MDIETARAFVNDPRIQRYINTIDRDAEAALDAARSNAAALGMLPTRFRNDYRRDATALDRAWGDFNAAWNDISVGNAQDGRAAMRAYTRYVLKLGVLEASNAKFGAYVRAGVFTAFAALSAAYYRHARQIKRRMEQDIRFLRGLDRELRRARRELTEAEAQRVINVAITAVSMLISVSTLGAGLVVAGGLFAIQSSVDAALGPSGPSLDGSAVNAASDLTALPNRLSPGMVRFAGGAAGIYGLVADTQEVALAESNIRTIEQMMRDYQRSAPRLQRMLRDAARDVSMALAFYEGTVRQARAERRRFRSQEARRQGLLRELRNLE